MLYYTKDSHQALYYTKQPSWLKQLPRLQKLRGCTWECNSSLSCSRFDRLFLTILPNYLPQKYNAKIRLTIFLDLNKAVVLLAAIQDATPHSTGLQPGSGSWAGQKTASLLSCDIHRKTTWGSNRGLSQVMRQHSSGYVTWHLYSFQ